MTFEDLINQWADVPHVIEWKRQLKQRKHCCVYLLECRGLYKIGRTENLRKRFKSIQVGNPFSIRIAHLIFTGDYIKVEQALHTIFANKRVRDEWFSLSVRDLAVLRAMSAPMILEWATSLKPAGGS
jgi:hypothetical protein